MTTAGEVSLVESKRAENAVFDAALARLGGDPSAVTFDEFVAEVMRGDVPEHLKDYWLHVGAEALLEEFLDERSEP